MKSQETPAFTDKNDGFPCENCGKPVPPAPQTCRNHCPHCLVSKHVDINPGDRLNPCKSLMDPVGYEPNAKKGVVLVFRCRHCGAVTKNLAAKDDDYDAILKIPPPALPRR
jgi:hypothetical protein